MTSGTNAAVGDESARRARWRWSGERVFSAALFGTALWLAAETLQFGAGARRVPLAVILPILGLLVAHLLRVYRSPRVEKPRNPLQGLVILWIVVLPIMIFLFGMYAGPGLYTFAFVRLRGRDTWSASVLLAAVVSAGTWLLVGVLLSASGPEGALWDLLLR